MIKRSVLVGMAASLLGLTLMTASPATATQVGIDKCQKQIAAKTAKLVKAYADIYHKCMVKWQVCRETQTVAACQALLTIPKAACDPDKLDWISATPGAMTKKLNTYRKDLGKKCDPAADAAVFSPAEFATLISTTLGTFECMGTDVTTTTDTLNGAGQELVTTTHVATTTGITGLPDCTPPITTLTQLKDCMVAQACEEAIDGDFSQEPYKGTVLALTEAGILPTATLGCLKAIGLPNLASLPCGTSINTTSTNNLAVGTHNVLADIKARLNTAVFPADLSGIVGQFEMDVSSVDPNGIATIDVPSKSVSFSPLAVPAFGLMVCTRQPTDGDGRLCCNTGGCGNLGPKDYTANQDHDSSGNNSAYGFVPFVGPADPGCIDAVSNSIAGLPANETLPCSEKQARAGACNNQAIGEANPNSHPPRCFGGVNIGKMCDPTSLATAAASCPGLCSSCALTLTPCVGDVNPASPGVGDCVTGFCGPGPATFPCAVNGDCPLSQPICSGPANACTSTGEICRAGADCPAGTACANVGNCASRTAPGVIPGWIPIANPCNGAATLVAAGTGFNDGDIVLSTTIQFTLEQLTIDNINNVTGAAGMDGVPDAFGADLAPCTVDDTAPPNNAAQIALTTGSALSQVFNSNMVPAIACPAAPGIIVSSDEGSPPPATCGGTPSVGVVPLTACANLRVSTSTGYELVATFPALDGSTTGDTATAVREELN